MAKKTKTALTLAFEELRKLGYFSKQNFWCCQTCAWHAIPLEQSDKAVFFHAQDAEDLKRKGECYLSWSGDGKEIVSVLNKHGIQTDWEGSETQRIKIITKKQ